MLGRISEYFLSRVASAEVKGGGEFYTPNSVVRLLVDMVELFRGRFSDPCCGSSGMFVQSAEFVDPHTTENGNLAWVQHMAPNRVAGFVLANGSMSSDRSGEGVIRGAPIAA